MEQHLPHCLCLSEEDTRGLDEWSMVSDTSEYRGSLIRMPPMVQEQELAVHGEGSTAAWRYQDAKVLGR